MDYRRFGSRIFFRLDRGEEIIETLMKLCKDEEIRLGMINAIGATDDAVIGLFDTKEKTYYKSELKGDMEIAPLSGNVSTMDGDTYLHLHINLGDSSNKAFAGHLNSAIVSATLEGSIDIIDGKIDRKKDEEIGLNLISFD